MDKLEFCDIMEEFIEHVDIDVRPYLEKGLRSYRRTIANDMEVELKKMKLRNSWDHDPDERYRRPM